MAEEEEDDEDDTEEEAGEAQAPPSEPPASETPKPKAAEPADAVAPEEPSKPVSKKVEWALAFAMIIILLGVLLMMVYTMRSARSAVM